MASAPNAIYRIVIGSLVYGSIPGWCHVPFSQPGFLSSPAYIEGNLNETVLIPCIVHDLGKNILRWWKDGTLLSDSSDDSLITPPRITLLTNNMLLIDWLEPGDAGNYTCEIVRAYPRMPLEQVHTVRVRYPPKIITIPASGYVEALLGSEVQMGCMAIGWPEPVVTWKFKDEVMKSMDNRHKLIFQADDVEKSGAYQCDASNDVGAAATSGIILRILYAPVIETEKTWIHSSPGMRTEIECKVTGEPTPQVEWIYEGEILQFESSRVTHRIRGNSHFLFFRQVVETDFGEYVCRAANKVGQNEKTIHLSGLAYPAVFKNKAGLVSPDSYSFIWEVDSYSPIIEYKLLFKELKDDDSKDWIEVIIPADTNSPGPLHSKSYTLYGLKQFTVYQARLISRNRFGWSEPSEIIKFGINGFSEIIEHKMQPVSQQINGGPCFCESKVLLSLISFLMYIFVHLI